MPNQPVAGTSDDASFDDERAAIVAALQAGHPGLLENLGLTITDIEDIVRDPLTY